ncbi:MAG: hypothetical protein PHS57_06230 [Alphaproteobacteria bacterium]|nr:hypothetical protein [Alphaproteobacteria bacterium]
MRKCEANGKPALFHRWADVAYTVGDGIAIGSAPGGQVMYPVAIVEYEDGAVDQVNPVHVRFVAENGGKDA